ncbi:MAG: hypothetical protein HC793_02765 [Aquincola sp.]|nr:hypothetical protein [Aquincola sp.]
MGTASAKSMRADDMDEVIFAGSGARRRVSMLKSIDDIVGSSAALHRTLTLVERVVATNTTVLINDGLITGVGPNLTVPPGSRVWDLNGATVYAGFIESLWSGGATNNTVDSSDFHPIGSRDDLRAGVAPRKVLDAPPGQTSCAASAVVHRRRRWLQLRGRLEHRRRAAPLAPAGQR